MSYRYCARGHQKGRRWHDDGDVATKVNRCANRCVVWLVLLLVAGCGGGGGGDAGGALPPPVTPPVTTVSVGGTLSGVTSPVTLLLNGGSALTLNADGAFTFGASVSSGAAYAVTVGTAPVGQTCAVTNGAGTTGSASVSNVVVNCAAVAPSTFVLGGTVSGAIGSVTLQHDGNSLVVAGNGEFAFPTRLAAGAAYAVVVIAQPASQRCSVSNATGTMPAADVKAVAVTCVTAAVAPPDVSLMAAPTTVSRGGRTSLSWGSGNASACTASGGWSGARATSGQEQTAALSSTTTFELTCTGPGGSAVVRVTVTVVDPTPAPTISLSASPTQVVSGATTMLSWSTTDATVCTASGGWSGSRSLSGTETSAPVTAARTFTLSCSGSGGSTVQSVTVNLAVPAPAITLTPDRPVVVSGTSVRIDYQVRSATSCTPTGDWTISIAPGSATSIVSGGQVVGPIARDSTFGLTCVGPGGEATATASIRLNTDPNEPPVAVDDAVTVDEDAGDVWITYAQLLANDRDPENRFGPVGYYQWELVSGAPLIAVQYCCSAGTGPGFRLAADRFGSIGLRYRIQDDIGQTSNWATITVTVRGTNDTPAAVDDSLGVIREIPTTLDVLANDRGVDTPATLEIVNAPLNGVATVVTESGVSRIRYTPRAGFEGADGLRYRMRDADGETAEAQLSLSVNPRWRISPARRFVRYGVTEPWAWTCNGATNQARAWAKDVYTQFKDSFDFIILLSSSGRTCSLGLAGQFVAARNDVSGIGLAVYDGTSLFGSAGRLRGVLWMPRVVDLLNGPALHELAHNWAQFIFTAEPAGLGSHWGFASGGQLGGFDTRTLRDLGGGQYQASNGAPGMSTFGLNAAGGNAIPYGDLELYLMGMRPAAGTGDFVAAKGAAFVSAAQGIFSATSLERETIDQLVTRLGVRSPAYPAAPHEFRVLTVVLTDSELSDSTYTLVDQHVELFGRGASDGDGNRYNFWEATRGEGRLQMENIDAELR